MSYVDEQIRDMIIKETPHADVRRQRLMERDPSLDDVLKKAFAYVTTTETDKILRGTNNTSTTQINKMSGSYHHKTRRTPAKENRPSNAEKSGKLKCCPGCFTKHEKKLCACRDLVCKN
jgi:hypothetical protein